MKKLGAVDVAQRLYRAQAEKDERDGLFGIAAEMYEKLGDVDGAQRLYRAEAEENERNGRFGSAAAMYEKIGNKELSLFMRYISELGIDSESRTLLQNHKHIEALQSLLKKGLITGEVFNLFMFDGNSPVSV
ncbi:hypothetical protein EBQ93_01670 [bacterium]|nr:hypothetical protein [bacterium]